LEQCRCGWRIDLAATLRGAKDLLGDDYHGVPSGAADSTPVYSRIHPHGRRNFVVSQNSAGEGQDVDFAAAEGVV